MRHNSGISRIDGGLNERNFPVSSRVVQNVSGICHHAAMKKVLVYVPVILSLVVLGAHFMRYGNTLAVFGVLLLIALLFVRLPWVARVMQAALILGALEWAFTIHELVQMRAAQGQPFTRMVIILGIVTVVTACSALLFQTQTMKRIYGLYRRERPESNA